MAITAFSTSLIPFGVAAGFLVYGCVMRLPRLALAGLGLALVCGQLVRFPLLGQGGGLLVSDVAVVGVLVAAWWQHLRQRRILPIGFNTIMLSIILFSCWSLFPLLLPGLGLTASELSVALLYWVRLCTYLLLLPALLIVVNTPARRNFLVQVIWGTIFGVLLTIVLQLWIVPDLRGLTGGWDPHLNRAVGSWLDPNFLGAFLGLSLLFSFPQALQRRRPWILLAIAGIVVAILLTRSRSTLVMLAGIVAMIVPILTLLPPRNWRKYLPSILGLSTLVIGLFVAAVILLKERAIGVFLFDPTVELRLQALKQVWQLVADHWLVGVGYNAYQFAALEAGLIGDFAIHSRAGADNSFLTLWVTTGLIGVALYVLLLGVIAWQLWYQWLRRRDASALAALLGGAGLVIHSQFINSLLYGHLLIMLTLIVVWGLTGRLAAAQKTTTVVSAHRLRWWSFFPLIPLRLLASTGRTVRGTQGGCQFGKFLKTPLTPLVRGETTTTSEHLRWFDWAVALVVLFIPTYLMRLNLFGIPTNLWEVLVGVVFLVGLLCPAVRRQWRTAWPDLPLTIKIGTAFFIAAAVWSTFISAEVMVSIGILKGWILLPICLGWLVYASGRTTRADLKNRHFPLIRGTKGVQEYFEIASNVNSSVGGYLPLIRPLIFSGAAAALLSLAHYVPGMRLSGIYDVPNSLALWLAPLLVLVVWQEVFEIPLAKKRFSVVFWLVAILMGAALVLTQSFGGILAVSLALLVGGVLWTRWRILAAIGLIVVVVAGLCWWRVSLGTQTSLAVRQQLWSVAAELIADHPVVGIGLGQFEPNYQRVLHQRFWQYEHQNQLVRADYGLLITDYSPALAQPIREFIFRDPHNWLFAFWLNLGLVGLLSFVVLNVYAIYSSFELYRLNLIAAIPPLIRGGQEGFFRNENPLKSPLSGGRDSIKLVSQMTNREMRAIILALLTLLLFGLVDTIYWKNDLAALHWVLLALTIGSASLSD